MDADQINHRGVKDNKGLQMVGSVCLSLAPMLLRVVCQTDLQHIVDIDTPPGR